MVLLTGSSKYNHTECVSGQVKVLAVSTYTYNKTLHFFQIVTSPCSVKMKIGSDQFQTLVP